MAEEPMRRREAIEADIEALRAEWAPKVYRYNNLRAQCARLNAVLRRLEPGMSEYNSAAWELREEHVRRLRFDGALPDLPHAHVHSLPNIGNHKNDGDELAEEGDSDHGGNECDFEVGSKG
jgi:hypothetical protein